MSCSFIPHPSCLVLWLPLERPVESLYNGEDFSTKKQQDNGRGFLGVFCELSLTGLMHTALPGS
jgi:hypothetical protein